MNTITSERVIGSVVYVDSSKANILLSNELKSAVYAHADGLTLISQVGGYLLFPSGVGEYIVGILTSAYEKEDTDFEKDSSGNLTLFLTQSNWTLRTNLLGTLVSRGKSFSFHKGISIYPSLGADAIIPNNRQIEAILSYQIDESKNEDLTVEVGFSPIYSGTKVQLSFQQLFAFCLGIVGNTGSGKSFTVASLIQQAIKSLNRLAEIEGKQAKPKFIILDINGEYTAAFKQNNDEQSLSRELNHAYLNGEDFRLPLWAFDNAEVCRLLRAAPQVQAPTLEKVLNRLRRQEEGFSFDTIDWEKYRLQKLLGYLDAVKTKCLITDGEHVGSNTKSFLESIKFIYEQSNFGLQWDGLTELINGFELRANQVTHYCYKKLDEDFAQEFLQIYDQTYPGLLAQKQNSNRVGDLESDRKPIREPQRFEIASLSNPIHWQKASKSNQEDDNSSSKNEETLIGLKLRVEKFLLEDRYKVFREDNWENPCKSFKDLTEKLISSDEAVTVIDCSMLDQEVLPFFCAVIGRILLSERQNKSFEERHQQPWCLILEEAHNYVRPYREGERSELRLCRDVFERVAKEGRKFGLSLIVASQRPSEISETILSQCANFIVHRLQNPNDIDYFKKVLPSGSKEVLDQVSILKPGETLIMGTSSNVPVKVQISKPIEVPQGHSPILRQEWIVANEEEIPF